MTDREREYVDLLVLVPLEDELREVLHTFPPVEDRSTDVEYRCVIDSGAPNLKVLVVKPEDMGKSHALRAVRHALEEMEAGVVICLGIAGSLSSDMRLGDVCYTGTVLDVLDNAKASDLDKEHLDIELSPTPYRTVRQLTLALNVVRFQPELRSGYETWEQQCEVNAKSVLATPVIGRDGQPEQLAKPRSQNGTIVCGSVSKSEVYNKKLRALDRKLLAIETESGGVFEAAGEKDTPALTIRGISDYADAGKNQLEAATKGLAGC